jgi:hypothetical protein
MLRQDRKVVSFLIRVRTLLKQYVGGPRNYYGVDFETKSEEE